MSAPNNFNTNASWGGGSGGNPGSGQWLSKPENLKTLAGGIGIAVGVLIVLGGGTGAKLFGLLVIVASWAVFLRHGYHTNAGLRVQARIPAAQAAQILTDLLRTRPGARMNVELTDSQPGQLRFIARTRPNPLTFRVALRQDPSGATLISTHLVKWTRRQSTSYFIPVPFTRRIDGYPTYKLFTNRALDALRQADPWLAGGFEDNPPE